MCLGKIFVENEQEISLIMDNVMSISIEDGQLILTTLMGERQTITGELKHIDFNKSKVIIKQTI